MADVKTKPGAAQVDQYLATIDDESRRADCQTLMAMMRQVTGEPPVMWGSAIVGFGRYHYRYDSGREGDACLLGFSSRKGDLSVYLVAAGPNQAALLARLGRHKMGKACLKLRRLADVDLAVLQALLEDSAAETRRRYP